MDTDRFLELRWVGEPQNPSSRHMEPRMLYCRYLKNIAFRCNLVVQKAQNADTLEQAFLAVKKQRFEIRSPSVCNSSQAGPGGMPVHDRVVRGTRDGIRSHMERETGPCHRQLPPVLVVGAYQRAKLLSLR